MRSGATQAATASQSRISTWNGSSGRAASASGASASIASCARVTAADGRLSTSAPSTCADQLFPYSPSLPRMWSSRVSPRQSSGCRPARAQNVPATSSSSTPGSPWRRATQWSSRPNAVRSTSSVAGASAPGAWAISHST